MVKESPETRDAYMMWEEKIFYERRDAKEEKARATILNMLKENLSVEMICRLVECDETLVEEVQKSLVVNYKC